MAWNQLYTPRRSCGAPLQPPKLQPKAQRPVELFDNFSGVFRMSYRLNDSASKVLSIFLDPENDFAIRWYIGKPGFSGVKLTFDQYRDLVDIEEKAMEFFNINSECQSKAAKKKKNDPEEQSEHGVRIKFDQGWITPLLKIATVPAMPNPDDDEKSFTSIGKTTYMQLVKYHRLSVHMRGTLETYQVGTRKLYANIVQELRATLPKFYTPDLIEKKLVEREIGDETWMVAGVDGFLFGYQEICYYELAMKCSRKMYNELKQV